MKRPRPHLEVALRVTLSHVSSVVRPLWMVALLLFSVHPVPYQGRLHLHPAHPMPLLHPCPRPLLVIDLMRGVVGGCPSARFPGN